MSWPRAALRDVGTWYGGGTPSKARPGFWTNGTIPWLSPKDMGAEVLHETKDRVTPAAVEGSSVKLVPEGSVAVVVRSGILERTLPVASVPFETTLNQDMKAVVPRDDIDPRWVAWGIRAFEHELLSTTRKRGTTVASLEIPRFLDFRLPVPPIDEQRRIIDFLEDHLSRIDAATSSMAVAHRRLQILRASALARAYDGPLVPLGDLAWEAGYGTSEKCVPDGPGVPVVRIPNLVGGSIDLTDEKRVASPTADVSSSMLTAGDILLVRTNGSVDLIGRSAVVQDGLDAAFASYLIRYRIKPEVVRPAWVHAMLSTPQLRSQIESLAASSAGQHNLSLAKLNPLQLPVPPLAEQDARLAESNDVNDRVSLLDAQIGRTQRRAASLRRSILSDAFAGRLTGGASNISEAEEMIGA